MKITGLGYYKMTTINNHIFKKSCSNNIHSKLHGGFKIPNESIQKIMYLVKAFIN